jgi:hypothetical protein
MVAMEGGNFRPPRPRRWADPDDNPGARWGAGDPPMEHGPSLSISGAVRLERRASAAGELCHCGGPIAAGQTGFRIVDFPVWVEHLVGERSFCSRACVRGFFVDSLAEIERLRSIDAERTVVDLRETYRDLALVFEGLKAALLAPPP